MSLRPSTVKFEDYWPGVLDTARAVITLGAVSRSVWNDRFLDVYKLCVAYPEPLSDELYKATKTFLEEHVEELCTNVKATNSSSELLNLYFEYWRRYSQGGKYLNMLYHYVNQQHVRKSMAGWESAPNVIFNEKEGDEPVEVGTMALRVWKKIMIAAIREPLVRAALEQIKEDRDGKEADQSTLHAVINSFVLVEDSDTRRRQRQCLSSELYMEAFEEPFLQATREYYRIESSQLHAETTCSVYMVKAIQRLKEENDRGRKFLHASTINKLQRVCESKLVEDHREFLQAECRDIVRHEIRHDMSSMYYLMKPINTGLEMMQLEFQSYIRDRGLEQLMRVESERNPGSFVEVLLEVHSHFHDLIKAVLNHDDSFKQALDKAFKEVVNYSSNARIPSKSPELLARYCDQLLKKSSKLLTESELDDKLDDLIIIFRYCEDKDIFQKFYSKMLAKRLIHGLSVSTEAEESMITKLKNVCGFEYTNHLHRMFLDINLSTDFNSHFSTFLLDKATQLPHGFSTLILQSGAWPLPQQSPSSFDVPVVLQRTLSLFSEFYNKRFNGRVLNWLHHLSNGELKLNYLKKPYSVTMTCYQMGVLLLFNDSIELSYSDMQEQTKLTDKELQKTLQSLVDVRLLLHQQEGDFELSSVLALNMSFSSKRTKFKITTAVQRETKEETMHTHSAVDDDRKLYLQAAIVRVMKSRKVLKHTLLVQEVISVAKTRFSPSVSMIKKCIEALIEKQYLERRDGIHDQYNYVA